MRIVGIVFIVLGFLISLSIVGAVFGIPMMLLGAVFAGVGGRRKVVINNTVTVANTSPAEPRYQVEPNSAAKAPVRDLTSVSSPVLAAPANAYDKKKMANSGPVR